LLPIFKRYTKKLIFYNNIFRKNILVVGETESVNITVSGFGANEIVNITITVGTREIARLQVHTDNNGRGTVLFTPNQNTYTGRCRIEATSPSGSAVLEITDQNPKNDLNPFDDERGGLTLEKVYERTITDRFGNRVTFKVHFTDQTLDSTGQTYDLPREILDEVVEAYRTQVEDWGFNRHLGAEYDDDGTVDIYINDGAWWFHELKPGTYAVSGSDRIICYQANLEQVLQRNGVYFGGVDHIIAHEHFHGIQYAYTQWKWRDQGKWYIEGTARFIETIMDAADTYNRNSLFYSSRYISPQHYMQNPDRQLTEFSYDYALFWGYLYAHDGGFSTIEQIFEEIRNAGDNPETDGPNAISRVLARAPGEHDSFEELIKDFHIAVYTKNLTWNGYNWGDHLKDVRSMSISFTGQSTSYSDSVNKWAADYYEIKVNKTNPNADNFYYKLEYPLLQLSKDFWSALILINSTGDYTIIEKSMLINQTKITESEKYQKALRQAEERGINVTMSILPEIWH
jgi:hypothetical protein